MSAATSFQQRMRDHAGARSGSRVDVAIVGVTLLMLLLGFTRLDRYPAPWFDEGIHLQVAKNVVIDGTYAARAADGTLDYAPAIGVGPTLLLPVAASLDLFGTSLTAGRAIPVIYLIVATLLLFSIARTLLGNLAAFATLAILLAMPALDWVETGRQVLGEVPALALLLVGGVLVHRAQSRPALLLAGSILGLSLVTKGQYVLIVPASLLALAVIDLRWTGHRAFSWHLTLFATVIGTWMLWIATLLLVIGDGNVVENVRLLRESSGGALLVFDPGRMAAAWKVMLGPSALLLVVPAALVGLVEIRASAGERRFALLALWLFQASWLGWFVVASIGWPRYAFAGLAVNAIFAGLLIARLAGRMHQALSNRQWSVVNVAALTACLALGGLLLAGGLKTLTPLTHDDSRDVVRFVAIMQAEVPDGAVVDAWEPELGFLSDRALQPPPPGSLAEAVEVRWFGGTMPDISADLQGDYLAIGPFGRWVGLYDDASLSSDWKHIAGVGQYDLYRRQH